MSSHLALVLLTQWVVCEALPLKNRFMASRVGAQKRANPLAHDDSVYRRLSNKGMFGGDVVNGIGLSDKNNGQFDLRKDPMRHYTHWPMGIVYYKVHPSAEEALPIIEAAMDEMTEKTCLVFEEIGEEDCDVKNYIYISADDPIGGCWSSVGMDVRRFQVMNLEKPTCWDKGVILHELVHTVGFYHEHQRPDRDEYISVLLHNVQDDIEPHQFSKLPEHMLMETGVPYDLDSIMHYDTHAFGKLDAKGRQLPTIIQKPPKHREMILPIWARPFLSRMDALEINVVYKEACAERRRLHGVRSQGRIRAKNSTSTDQNERAAAPGTVENIEKAE